MHRSSGSPNMINIESLQKSLGHVRNCIPFLHAASGCDTTSTFFNKAKAAALKILEKNKQLANADPESISNFGEFFTLCLYGAPKDLRSINQLRYIKFNQITASKSLTKEMQLGALPPTKNALSQHFYRVYHHIQLW